MAVILRASERVAVPWKNGGGLTREVAAHPPGSDLGDFDWRVSLAEVLRGGPFSTFSAVDRHMAVVSGRLKLSIEGRDDLTLAADGGSVSFPGDVPASGEALQAPVTDLNVMTRRGRYRARLTHCRAPHCAALRLQAETTLVLALAPLTLRGPSSAGSLGALDAARFPLERHSPATVSLQGTGINFWLIELRAV